MSKLSNIQYKIQYICNKITIKLLQYLPVSSEIIGGPKGFYESTSDWIVKSNQATFSESKGSYKEIYQSEKIYRSEPKTLGNKIYWKFEEAYQFESPKTFVAIVPNGRVWGFSGSAIAPDDKLLADVSVEFVENLKFHSVFNQIKLPRAHKINRTVAVLSATGGQTFFHFMFDVVPRIHLIRCAEINFNEIDYFLVNSYESSFQQEMLTQLGIPSNKIIESCKYPHIKADKLIVPSLPGVVGNPPNWSCKFLRQEFLKSRVAERSSHTPDRLYISRAKANWRQVVNENDVMNLLRFFGFKNVCLETLSISEQVQIFAAAKVIIAPHGAGLSNAVYCQPGTKIIEIFSPNYIKTMYWCISNQMGLDYYYLIGEGQVPPDYVDVIAIEDDITVNLDALSSIMEIAGIE